MTRPPRPAPPRRRRAPSLVTIARRALTGECALERGKTLLVAVSGGPDSMALLDVAARLAHELGLGLFAHGVDHGLRADAALELDLAEAHAASLDVPFARSRVAVARGGNVQARARAARWQALELAAQSVRADAIATAHHADDRAETLLLRLLRGAGPRGLAVLPPRAPSPSGAGGVEVVRPLLRARRDEILAYLARHAIAFARDPSNLDRAYLRTRVRRELLPLLEELGPGIVRHLESLADQLAAVRDGSDASAYGLPRATLHALAAAVRSSSPSARVWLPSGLVVSIAPPAERRGPRKRMRS